MKNVNMTHVRKLASARWVHFLVPGTTTDSYDSYYVEGIVLRCVQGYTSSEIKKIQRLRAKKSIPSEITKSCKWSFKKTTPLRNLDTHAYALILLFEEAVNDYVTRWVKIEDLSVATYVRAGRPLYFLVPREEGVRRAYSVGVRVKPLSDTQTV